MGSSCSSIRPSVKLTEEKIIKPSIKFKIEDEFGIIIEEFTVKKSLKIKKEREKAFMKIPKRKIKLNSDTKMIEYYVPFSASFKEKKIMNGDEEERMRDGREGSVSLDSYFSGNVKDKKINTIIKARRKSIYDGRFR